MKKYIIHFILSFTMLFLFSCEDAWDDHTKISESTASRSLEETLTGLSGYSNFVSALKVTGLMDTLKQSMLFTVWVPSNEVFSDLPSNEDELYRLVANHISKGSTKVSFIEGANRVKMLSGKVLDVTSSSVAGVAITEKDMAVKNGIIQIVAKSITVKNNIWEYIASYGSPNKHIEYINSLSGEYFDPEVADITGYTDKGEPIYDMASGMVWKNLFLENVADLRVEDSTYTVLIIADAAYNAEYEKYKDFFKVTSGISEQDLLRNKAMGEYKITKDYVFAQKYKSSDIPTQLLSVDSVLVPINKELIYTSVECSNGWVHHIQSAPVPLKNKILPIKVEGETTARFYDNYTIAGKDITGTPGSYKRVRPLASGGFDYVLDNRSNSAASGLILHAGQVASMRYKFYWKAVNDFGGSYSSTVDTLRQKVGYTTLIKENNFRYDFNPMIAVSDFIDVLDESYDTAQEVEVGAYKFTSMRDVYVWLQSQSNGSAVVADYIKLVPDFD